MATQLGSRLVYQQAKAAIDRAGYSAGKAVLSQSYLRFEAVLSTTKAQYQFDVLVNESLNGVIATQNQLNLQDAFVVSEIGVFVANPSGLTATDFRLFTYDNSTVFTGANVVNGIRTVYNGQLQLSVNQRQIVTGWDVNRHYYVPQQQQAANADYTTSGINYQDQVALGSDGFFPCEPNWVMVGSKKNLLTLNLPQAPAAVLSNSRVVVIMRGVLGQNVTPVN